MQFAEEVLGFGLLLIITHHIIWWYLAPTIVISTLRIIAREWFARKGKIPKILGGNLGMEEKIAREKAKNAKKLEKLEQWK